jgi:hypothetical protein
MEIDRRITDFIKEHHVLTLATTNGDEVWCANCFYAYIEEINALIFTSDDATRHIKDVKGNPQVAASVVLETSVVGKIQGIQIQGELVRPREDMKGRIKKVYLKRFPYAALMNTSLWVLNIHYLKMTDNRLGFGKKLIWEK